MVLKNIIIFLVALMSADAMARTIPWFFGASSVITNMELLNVNNKYSFQIGTVDPTVTPRDALKGSMYCRTGASGGACYTKQDNGNTTTWQILVSGTSTTYGRVATAISYTVLSTDTIVGVTNNSSARTITLPLANSVPAGHLLIIKDEACTAASANNITVTRSGSDQIDNLTSVLITANCGAIKLYSNGVSKWESI
jgi:hypothetical protein